MRATTWIAFQQGVALFVAPALLCYEFGWGWAAYVAIWLCLYVAAPVIKL